MVMKDAKIMWILFLCVLTQMPEFKQRIMFNFTTIKPVIVTIQQLMPAIGRLDGSTCLRKYI